MADILLLTYSLLFGLIIGSFLNVCIYRIPAKISIAWPPSACPKCKSKIKWYDNVPVLSYLILRGKCRNCKEKISIQYPIVELFTGLLTVLFVLQFGISIWTPLVLFIIYCLIVLSVIDIKIMIIPDRFSIGLTLFGIMVCFFNPAFTGVPFDKFLSSLGGAAIGFFGLWALAVLGQVVFKKEAMGGGDIKLMAAIGALSGGFGVLNALVVSSFAGILYFGVLVLLRRPVENGAIPFGPFLSAGLLFNLFFPGGMLFYF